MKAYIVRILKRAEINRAVFFSLLAKFWGTLSGPVTLLFISLFYTADVQGYYYTFLSLLALQTFLELSFSTVIINFASHEWAQLHLTENREIGGDSEAVSRLSDLVRFSVRWYLVLSILFVIGVGIGGYIFLWKKHDPLIFWQGPWCVMVVLVGLQLLLMPLQSTLEGCNQIASMSLIRMTASMVGAIGFWLSLYLRLGLWAPCILYGLNWLTQVILVGAQYGPFFKSLLKASVSRGISWTHEILPLQWRLGVSGVVNYFGTSLFTPVMFWYHGAKIAGQMGMGWQIMGAAQAISLTWIQASVPVFGGLISHKKYKELDHLFFRITAISGGILLLLCGAAWGIVKFMVVIKHRIGERFMPPEFLWLFLLAAVFMHLPQCQAAYLRAHKREPLLVISIVSSLTIGALVWILGKNFGLAGAGWAYLSVLALMVMPTVSIIWVRRRREWHA